MDIGLFMQTLPTGANWMFGLETWGGASLTLRRTIQKIQDQASKWALPAIHHTKSARQRQKILGWLPIEDEILRAVYTMTYRILNTGKPQEIASKMPPNHKSLRIKEQNKLDTRPRWLSSNKTTKALFRARAYRYNMLPKSITTQVDVFKFKKEIQKVPEKPKLKQ